MCRWSESLNHFRWKIISSMAYVMAVCPSSMNLFLLAQKRPHFLIHLDQTCLWAQDLRWVFHSERNPPSNSRVIAPEILKIALFDLVSIIETIFLNQPGPKLHKVFIGTRSWMSSLMSKIGPVTRKLFALELLKIAVLNLVSAIETTFLNQSGPKLHKVFIGTRSRMSLIMSEICLVTRKLFALELLKIVVYVCRFTICHCSLAYIYWWILI